MWAMYGDLNQMEAAVMVCFRAACTAVLWIDWENHIKLQPGLWILWLGMSHGANLVSHCRHGVMLSHIFEISVILGLRLYAINVYVVQWHNYMYVVQWHNYMCVVQWHNYMHVVQWHNYMYLETQLLCFHFCMFHPVAHTYTIKQERDSVQRNNLFYN
jgi:hypothetical protein